MIDAQKTQVIEDSNLRFPGVPVQHLTDARQLSRAWMETELFPLCDSLRNNMEVGKPLAGRALYGLFYEPSFLTRTSFERAMLLMGGQVQFTEDASQFFPVRTSSYVEDTVKFLASLYFDVVVLRSNQPGAPIANITKTRVRSVCTTVARQFGHSNGSHGFWNR